MKNSEAQACLDALRQGEHPACILCNPSEGLCPGIRFCVADDLSVHARCCCDDRFQGREGLVSGGVLALLLDGAMTNCLFAHGKRALTGELTVRYLHPVVTNRPIDIVARIVRARRRLYLTEGTLSQDGRTVVLATAKFMATPAGSEATGPGDAPIASL